MEPDGVKVAMVTTAGVIVANAVRLGVPQTLKHGNAGKTIKNPLRPNNPARV